MTKLGLILSNLRHSWRTHTGTLAGAILAGATLTGALIIGDSVRHTLRSQALTRIGQADGAIVAGDRLVPTNLADRLSDDSTECAPVLQLRAVASTASGEQVAHRTNLLGVDGRFFRMMGVESPAVPIEGGALINARLAQRLGVQSGDSIVVRVEQPSALPRATALATNGTTLGLRVRVVAIASDESFGRFSLSADQLPPFNVFVPIDWLNEQLELSAKANLLLVQSDDLDAVETSLHSAFTIEDAQLAIGTTADGRAELTSGRIFIDPPVEEIVRDSELASTGILTYFVNSIEHGDLDTPYSMVSGVGSLGPGTASLFSIPNDLDADQIVVNSWLADDLECSVGDELLLRYYALDDDDTLVEREAPFTVSAIVSMEQLEDARSLMPPFPGIAEAEESRDWEPGVPIDLGRIRDKDEEYWDTWRGTPKAFVSLDTAQNLWANRYGGLTSVRLDRIQGDALRHLVHSELDPSLVRLSVVDIRTPALTASRATTDFGGLFLGLSFFLIAAALLLMSLLYVFTVEQRTIQLGTLLAVGFRSATVRRLLLIEAGVLALLGSTVGSVLSIAYTRAILGALTGIWSDAVASAGLRLFVNPTTVLMGGVIAFLAAVASIWFALRRAARREPVELLHGGADLACVRPAAARKSMLGAGLLLLGAVGTLVTAVLGETPAMAFFGAGSLLLIAFLLAFRVMLVRSARDETRAAPTLASSTRRINRSVAAASLLACGVFLVVGVSVNQIDPMRDAGERSSGTGGFAFVAESSIPINRDLNTQRGRDAFGLSEGDVSGVSFVAMRVRDGDDASCLNLNHAQSPRVLGVDPEELESRGAFTFVQSLEPDDGWNILDVDLPSGAVPAVADDASAKWAMHRSLGDPIEYTDEHGRTFEVVIAATVAGSVLQGNLLIAESRFDEAWPSETGDRCFLIDAPQGETERLEARLERALGDTGMELTPATQRLAEFSAVQNTYLSIFQMLGGIGLLLGTLGLGIVVARNVLERRSELALLRAVGFNLRAIRSLLVREHAILLLAGLACGAISAGIAVIPAVATRGFPLGFTLALLAILTGSGILWVWLASALALPDLSTEALDDQ